MSVHRCFWLSHRHYLFSPPPTDPVGPPAFKPKLRFFGGSESQLRPRLPLTSVLYASTSVKEFIRQGGSTTVIDENRKIPSRPTVVIGNVALLRPPAAAAKLSTLRNGGAGRQADGQRRDGYGGGADGDGGEDGRRNPPG